MLWWKIKRVEIIIAKIIYEAILFLVKLEPSKKVGWNLKLRVCSCLNATAHLKFNALFIIFRACGVCMSLITNYSRARHDATKRNLFTAPYHIIKNIRAKDFIFYNYIGDMVTNKYVWPNVWRQSVRSLKYSYYNTHVCYLIIVLGNLFLCNWCKIQDESYC